MTYRYLISWTTPQGKFGGTDYTRPEPIRDMDDVQAVMRDLSDHYDEPDLTVTAFSRFEEASR